MNKQTIIPKNIIHLAKAIQKAEASNSHLLIVQARSHGKKAAYKLAHGDQIFPTNPPTTN